MFTTYGYLREFCSLLLLDSKDSDRELENLREFYKRDFLVKKMSGEMPELLKLSIRMGMHVGFSLNFGKPEMFGTPIRFNDITGRITIKGGGTKAGEGWVRSFLIRQVKMFTFSAELYEEWEKTR